MAGQLQDVPFEGLGVAAALVGEVDGHLTHHATVGTAHAGYLQGNLDGPTANGKTTKPTLLGPATDDPPGAARRTAKVAPFLADREDHGAPFILRSHVGVAANPKPMIQ